MSGSNHEAIVSRLKTLNSVDPQEAMDEVSDLIEGTSVGDLAKILDGTFPEISQALRIDWHFTAVQWKLGNQGCEEFAESFPKARFKVWSLPFHGSRDDGLTHIRYATCLPFQLKEELASGPK